MAIGDRAHDRFLIPNEMFEVTRTVEGCISDLDIIPDFDADIPEQVVEYATSKIASLRAELLCGRHLSIREDAAAFIAEDKKCRAEDAQTLARADEAMYALALAGVSEGEGMQKLVDLVMVRGCLSAARELMVFSTCRSFLALVRLLRQGPKTACDELERLGGSPCFMLSVLAGRCGTDRAKIGKLFDHEVEMWHDNVDSKTNVKSRQLQQWLGMSRIEYATAAPLNNFASVIEARMKQRFPAMIPSNAPVSVTTTGWRS